MISSNSGVQTLNQGSQGSSGNPYIQKPSLQFQTNLPFHNLSLHSIKQLSSQEYIIQPSPDPSKPGSKLWFHFLVICHESNVYTIRIDGISKKKLSWNGCFIKKATDTKWKRISGNPTLFHRGYRSHNTTTHIEITLKLNKDTTYEIAYFPPYTYSYLRSRLKRWHKMFPDRCKVEKVTNTYEGRSMNLVTISASDELKRPTVCITGRIHPGEVPSSWIIDGLLEYLIESDSIEAARIREKICFRVIPMLNPDGCEHGYYRCNAIGHDLNRFWLNPSEKFQPEVYQVRKLLLSWKESEKYSLDFFIDVHAHSSGISSFMYYNSVVGVRRKEELLRLPRILSRRSNGQFSFKLCKMDTSEKKIGCSRRALGDFLQIAPFAYTLETSFLGYYPNGNSRLEMVHFHSQHLKNLGRHIADSIDEYYQSRQQQEIVKVDTVDRNPIPWNSSKSQKDFLWNDFVSNQLRSNSKKIRHSSQDIGGTTEENDSQSHYSNGSQKITSSSTTNPSIMIHQHGAYSLLSAPKSTSPNGTIHNAFSTNSSTNHDHIIVHSTFIHPPGSRNKRRVSKVGKNVPMSRLARLAISEPTPKSNQVKQMKEFLH